MKVPGRLHGRCSRVTAGKTPCGWLRPLRGEATRQRFLCMLPSLQTTHCHREHPEAKTACAMIAPRHSLATRLDAALLPICCASPVPRVFIRSSCRARATNSSAIVCTGVDTITISNIAAIRCATYAAIFSPNARANLVAVRAKTLRRIPER